MAGIWSKATQKILKSATKCSKNSSKGATFEEFPVYSLHNNIRMLYMYYFERYMEFEITAVF